MRRFIALPDPSRSALDDALIVLRMAIAYAALGLLAHQLAGWLMRELGHYFHIDTQFLILDALFAALIMLGGLGLARVLQPRDTLQWMFGRRWSVTGALIGMAGAVLMVWLADPLADWIDIRLPDRGVMPEGNAAPQAITPLLELSGGRFLAGLMLAVLWVPMAEEWIFRGWLFRGLQRTRPGLLVALPATTLIFSLLHSFYSPGGVLVIGMLGLFLGWLRWRYDQLWLCVLAHATYNWVTLLRVAVQ
ncbi:CPBP family intramembrane metalloprotease [Halopseudomonas nanhaiensis]|uniref:type II CAAX endopeptidase family protein n=1 Tax=Halopseudomonas nanhaiensis TaxID=2830842 RepID=UPI001CBBC27F|nr:type II CAAX endopeptidase family protein [Halopseudomonas nanhaiensis]UAW97143.1 CPBP family intramembrane metalloprotease [Halopseudomonas nanhaiensis]